MKVGIFFSSERVTINRKLGFQEVCLKMIYELETKLKRKKGIKKMSKRRRKRKLKERKNQRR